MKKYQKIVKYSPVLLLAFWAMPARAVCPVCTVAVGAGVGLARYFKIEDTITGVWIGGLIMSLSFWTIDWMGKKNHPAPRDPAKTGKLRFRNIAIILGYFLITIVPLYFMGIAGHPMNEMCGVDKLLLGSIVGSLGFFVGLLAHLWLKDKNGNKVYFPFQKVAASIAPLLILSLMFYIISKC